jgi:HAD superfamily hydrolase (TIGR01509 family)
VAIRRIAARGDGKLHNVVAVFFDVGGTLVYSNRGHIDLLHEALCRIGYTVSRDEVARANDLARQAVARRRRRHAAGIDTRLAGRMWLDHLAEALRLETVGDKLEAELAAAVGHAESRGRVSLDPDAAGLLDDLHRSHLRLGVISNWSADLPEYLDRHGLARYFDVVIASEAVGSAKPHREIFLRGLAALGCEPGNAVHVGDDYWTDVVGARGLGMWPVLLDRTGEDPHDDCPAISRLGDLKRLLL